MYGFTEAAKTGVGWLSVEAISYLVGAIILLVAFVFVELRSASPLLPMRVVLDRNRGGTYLASLLVGAGLFAMFLFLSYYFQYNLGYSALKSGVAFLPFSGGVIVAAGAASALLPRTGPKPLMLVGLALGTVGLVTFTFISDTSSWVASVLPGELLMSVGLGLVFVPLSSLALTGVSDDDAGVASAVLNSTQQIGGSLGTALLNTFYASAVTSYVVVASPFAVGVQSARGDPRLSRRVLDRGRADRGGLRGHSGAGQREEGRHCARRGSRGRRLRSGEQRRIESLNRVGPAHRPALGVGRRRGLLPEQLGRLRSHGDDVGRGRIVGPPQPRGRAQGSSAHRRGARARRRTSRLRCRRWPRSACP